MAVPGREGPRWAPRVPRELIRRLYETDASGLVDEELIDEVGCSLLLRCEAIRRVTHRLCPTCGGKLAGALGLNRQAHRPIRCEQCAWVSTWRTYHRSYKGSRIHGGRAFPAFIEYLERFPKAGSPQEKMRLIDALAHAIHEDGSGHWTLPASVNFIEGSTGRSSRCWTPWPA